MKALEAGSLARAVVLGLGLGGLAHTPVFAQDAAESIGLEEIVVTARKREESAQKVPEAVSAMTAEQLDRTFQSTGAGLEGVSPNLVFDRIVSGPGGAALSVRGLSFQDIEKSFDTSVGVSLDGVYLGTNTGQVFQIFDFERMEVLRGPQGTLFGKNTIGGIINIVRPEPTGELGGKFRVNAGNYNKQEFDGVLNLPMLADQLSTKVFYTNRQMDGVDRNIAKGNKRVGGVDYESYGATLKWTPTDRSKIIYTYQKENDDSPIGGLLNLSLSTDAFCVGTGFCSLDGNGVIPQTGDAHTVNQNGSDKQFYEVDAHTLAAQVEVADGYTLNYVFGNRKSDEETNQDFDATPLSLYETVRTQEYEQTSHELRFTYDQGGRFNLVTGVYFWEADYVLHQDTNFGGTPITQDTDHDSESWAAFAQSDIELTDEWILTLGGRYTKEEKSMESQQSIPGVPVAFFGFDTFGNRAKESWSKFTPKAGIRWEFADEQMVYLSYSSGFRSGGFNGRAGSLVSATLPYDPETVDSTELGYKSQWLDDRVRFNANIFYSQYKDKQEEVVLPTTGFQETLVVNASEATFKGLEVELLYLPLPGWTLRLNGGYLDAEYDKFCAVPTDPFTSGPSCGPNGEQDISGLKLRRAPELTGSFDSSYTFTAGPGDLTLNGSVRYKDKYYTTFQNIPMGLTKAAAIYDASLSYDVGDLRVSLYGQNLTDKTVRNSALYVAGLWSFGTSNMPRTYGAQLQYKFGK